VCILAKILWHEGLSLENLPVAKPVHETYRAFLIQGFKDLVNDCYELAAVDGGTLADTFIPAGVLLADFAELLQLDHQQLVDIFGPYYSESLIRDGLVKDAVVL
jgi:hypothetical protein